MKTGVRPLFLLLSLNIVWCSIAHAQNDEQLISELSGLVESYNTLSSEMQPYDALFRRDPTQPLVTEEGKSSAAADSGYAWSVQGIIWSDTRPLVIVDDELLPVGSVVGPYTIKEIHPDGVLVVRGEDPLFIPLDRSLASPEPPQAEPAL